MMKLKSLRFSIGNIILLLGLLLLIADFIFLVYARADINSQQVVAALSGVGGSIAFIALGMIVMNIDRKMGEKGVMIGQTEKHQLKAMSKGKKVILYVDEKPELEFFGSYRRMEKAGTVIGDVEKHKVDVKVRVSALSGDADKWIYVDDELVLKDEKPLW
ncbi:MAG: hypothetical protein QF682_08965 [Candidatus Thermoplasmatota archaeon]|nr:hypothetical protein [Candidatus Thermoplasmatota archaeon]